MSGRLDVVVIGAGHNGLTAAALLARAGRRVVVLERRDRVGGLAAGEEFAPGYRDVGLLQDTTGVRPDVVRELELERHGLRTRSRRPETVAIGDAEALVIGDEGRGAEALQALDAFVESIRPTLAAWTDAPPADLVIEPRLVTLARAGLRLRRLGRSRLHELLRLPPMPIADWIAEWIDDDLLRAACVLPALSGTTLGPRSPGSTANLLLREALAGPGTEGGGAALVGSLERAAEAAGVEIRTDCAVDRIVCGPDGVEGVVAGGRTFEARAVAASCDPRQLFERLVPAGRIESRLARNIAGFRCRGTTAYVRLALREPLRFERLADRTFEHARIAPGLDAIERAHDAAKHGALPDRPVLELRQPSTSNPELAPDGHAVVSILVHFVPYGLTGGWSAARREELGERVLAELERHSPGVTGKIVAREIDGPVEIESRYGCRGGQIHHGEHALDQILVRPVPECVGYATPVRGLWLCGSGSHPGGGLTCGPGALAARAISRHA